MIAEHDVAEGLVKTGWDFRGEGQTPVAGNVDFGVVDPVAGEGGGEVGEAGLGEFALQAAAAAPFEADGGDGSPAVDEAHGWGGGQKKIV